MVAAFTQPSLFGWRADVLGRSAPGLAQPCQLCADHDSFAIKPRSGGIPMPFARSTECSARVGCILRSVYSAPAGRRNAAAGRAGHSGEGLTGPEQDRRLGRRHGTSIGAAMNALEEAHGLPYVLRETILAM